MTDAKLISLKTKLQESRFRLITRYGDFAGILKTMLFVAVKNIRKMSTNGYCIYFDAAWLEKLDGHSLDYALAHQLMHIHKEHIFRSKLYSGDRYHYACNIIVNARLVDLGFTEDKLSGIGELNRKTIFPKKDGYLLSPEEAFRMCPLDPAAYTASLRKKLLFDTDDYWGRRNDRGENGIIVLSPADDDPYGMKPSDIVHEKLELILKGHGNLKMPQQNIGFSDLPMDDLEDFTTEYIDSPSPSLSVRDTVQDIRDLKELDESGRDKDAMVERAIKEVRVIHRNWRAILNNFISVETKDYDFLPPDRRIQDDFFMPDFSEDTSQKLKVLFMIDISASLTNTEVSMAMAETAAAIEQFNGMLEGTVGFFDTEVRRTLPICGEKELYRMFPDKGGGTDMQCVFDYVRNAMSDAPPSEIVIMTDGKCDFPDYSETCGIPVLWLLTNNKVRIPWGRAAYFERL